MQVNTGKDTFDYVELVDPSHPSSARIAPSRGGLAYSFVVKGREAFALDRDSFTDTTKNVRGGVPVLFPIAGPVKDETYLADGKPYKMKQHGFGRLMPWKVVGTSTAPVPSMTMELTATEATKASYPWDFVVRYTYELAKDTLTLKQEYTNRSATPMPVHAGFHPYFRLADKLKSRLEIPATRFQDMIAWTEHEFSGTVDWSKDVIDIVFLDMKKNQAAVVDTVDKVRITLEHDAPFKYVVFWTTKAAQFVCVEPWTGRRFAMNSGEDIIQVEPGTTFKTWCSFRVTPAEA